MGVPDDAEDVSVDVDIGGERTVITVAGTRDAAVVVSSGAGEEVYLPPENFDGASEPDQPDSPYDSPYEGSPPADSPYESAEGGSRPEVTEGEGRGASSEPIGLEPTGDGFRILHPEPVTDVRFIR